MMPSFLRLSVLALTIVDSASAHYGFPFTVVNGVVSKRWEHVRPASKFFPVLKVDGPEGMCGFNATLPAFPIKTIKIAAGSEIGFGATIYHGYISSTPRDPVESEIFEDFDSRIPFRHTLHHSGPAAAYLSKAPGDDLNGYNGDGSWFKFASVGASDGMIWDIGGHKNKPVMIMNFTIPASTPPGHYLLRVEHLNMLQAHVRGGVELFPSCAHVEITGAGTGTPEPQVKFPFYTRDDPSIWLPILLAQPYKAMDELKNWQGAGPAVWQG